MERVKYELEFPFNCSAQKLYEYISTSHGLLRWFANDVTEDDNGKFKFTWDDIQVHGVIDKKKRNKFIRFHIEENPEGEYFELRIESNEITKDNALIITDFSLINEKQDYIDLWNYQIKILQDLINEE